MHMKYSIHDRKILYLHVQRQLLIPALEKRKAALVMIGGCDHRTGSVG